MAEKSAKKKPKKSAKSGDAGVLGTLSSSRPARLGGDRRGTRRPAAAATTAKQAAATKPKAAKAVAESSSAKAGATKTPATKASTRKASAAKAKPKTVPQPPRTEAPPAGWQVPGDGDGRRDGGPAELVTTAVQAAGEVAQLGLAVGGQLLRRVAGRIPGR